MEVPRTSSERPPHLAGLALVCLLLNVGILFLAPFARPDLDIWHRSLSYYAVGPWAIVQNAAFVSMGLASLALGVALLWPPPGNIWQRASGLALLVGGLSSIGLVVFPIDATGPSTFLGDTHQTAGTIGGVALLVATLAMGMAARTNPSWSRLRVPALIALILSVTGAVATQASIWWVDLGIPRGLTMRLVVAPLVIFWSLVAQQIRRSNEGSTRTGADLARGPTRR
jgi:hypothetical protein